MYGMGASSIANDLGITTKEANQILDDFYKGFPRVKEWQEYSREFAKKNGYSEDFWGRRRRLPKIQLPEYEIINKNAMSTFNPLLDAKGIKDSADDQIIQSYISQLQKCRSNKDKEKIKADAIAKGYIVKDNGGFISQAERECVNARVQGGAASMTKLAMRKLYDDKELTDLGFKIVLQIHDEIIGECPEENAERCCELLTRDMRESVKEWISVPFKCDGTLIKAWYIDEYENGLKNDFNKLINGDPKKNKPAIPYDEALSKIINDHTECTVDQIYNFLGIEQKDN